VESERLLIVAQLSMGRKSLDDLKKPTGKGQRPISKLNLEKLIYLVHFRIVPLAWSGIFHQLVNTTFCSNVRYCKALLLAASR